MAENYHYILDSTKGIANRNQMLLGTLQILIRDDHIKNIGCKHLWIDGCMAEDEEGRCECLGNALVASKPHSCDYSSGRHPCATHPDEYPQCPGSKSKHLSEQARLRATVKLEKHNQTQQDQGNQQ